MSDIPRQAKISITYSGSGGINSQTLKARIKEFTYEDPATGESDIISIDVDPLQKEVKLLQIYTCIAGRNTAIT